jgi:hypothetical protein
MTTMSTINTDSAPPEPAAGMRFVPDASAPAAKRLVASYPPEQQPQVAQAMAELLARYRALEERFGLEPNDVAGAVAAFVAGNYMAYRDVEFPDAGFMPLVRQMRGVIAALPQLRDASDAQKQQLYEEMAVVGMHMALQRAELRGASAAAKAQLRRTAKAHLDQFLQTDCSRLALGDNGLGALHAAPQE